MRSFAFAVAILLAIAGISEAKPSRVGVVVNLRVNLGQGEADALAEALGVAIRKRHGVDVIAGNEAARRLPGTIREDCVAERECINDMAARLDADQLLFLVMVKVGDSVQIDSTWVDPATGRTLSRDAIEISKNETPYSKFKEASMTLLPYRDRDNKPNPPTAPIVKRERERDVPISGWVPVIAAAGVSFVGLTGGLALSLAQRADYNALADAKCAERVCNAAVNEQIASLGKRSVLTDVLLGTAGLAAATAVVLFVLKDDGISVGGLASPDGAMVSVGGGF